MAVANYMGIDKERYDQGNKFYSQDPYLQGTGLDKPAITFNPSNYDTGITSQYGNNSMYGTPNQGGDSMGATMPIGNFNQKDNLFEVGPMSGAAPGSFRAAQDIGINQTPVGRFDGLKNIAGKVGNYGLRAMSSQMGAQGGAMLGGMIPGGILPILLGAGAGGKFGFDMSGRGPTDAERVTANFYGNQGNSPMQYLDEEGNLVDSMMQGYNISSAFGKGIGSALQGRIDRINKTISNPNYRGQLKVRRDGKKSLLDKLLAEQKALETATQTQANNMQDSNRAMGTGGYQAGYSDDFMEGPDPNASNQDLTSTMGSS